MESLKKSLNVLTLLAPPYNSNDDYSGYVNSSKNVEVEILLDQPAEKRFVITVIADIVVYARFWIKMEDDTLTQPMFIQLIS